MRIEVNHQDLAYVQSRLKGMEDQAPRALRDAVNRTAIYAQRRLAQEAQKRYTVKSGGFYRHARISPRATISSPVAVIHVDEGKPLSQPRFHTTYPKGGVKTEVLKGSGLKTIVGPRNIKAFVAKVATGIKNVKHTATQADKTAKHVLQREGKSRYPLKALHGPSAAKMVEMVYETRRGGGEITDAGLKKEIEEMYHKNVEAEIGKVLAAK